MTVGHLPKPKQCSLLELQLLTFTWCRWGHLMREVSLLFQINVFSKSATIAKTCNTYQSHYTSESVICYLFLHQYVYFISSIPVNWPKVWEILYLECPWLVVVLSHLVFCRSNCYFSVMCSACMLLIIWYTSHALNDVLYKSFIYVCKNAFLSKQKLQT